MKKELRAIKKSIPKNVVIEECLTESYFSNSLSWLLNPNGSSNSVEFINQFTKMIANKRAKDTKLHTKANTLKAGRNGNGTSYTKFNFANSHTVREYHLSKSLKGRGNTNYCDLIVFDLDASNPIMITIENKLFGAVDKYQLLKYHSQCENKFSNVKTREYVVIGIGKDKPSEIINNKNWIYVSWLFDIKPIVDKLSISSKRSKRFKFVLVYLLDIYSFAQDYKFVLFSNQYLNSITNCFIDELNRIKSNRGNWVIQSSSSNQNVIFHTSAKKKKLYIDYLSNLNIAIQSHSKSNKPIFEKVCIPFGLNEQQLLNQIELFSKDIYKYHFGESYRIYLGGKHRRNRKTNPFPILNTKIFSDASSYAQILKHLLQFSKKKLIKREYK